MKLSMSCGPYDRSQALIDGSVRLVGLQPDDMTSIIEASGKYRLDFDDAYQYVASAKFNFQIVSFDSDFDRTDLGKRLPEQIESEETRDSNGTAQ